MSADIDVGRQLHADDFQLINPLGGALSKGQYLGAVAVGDLNYLVWGPELTEVRLYGEMALIRYRSQIEIVVQGQIVPRRHYWHTDAYEKRGGRVVSGDSDHLGCRSPVHEVTSGLRTIRSET